MTHTSAVILLAVAVTVSVSSQQAPIGYDDTPMQPNGKWRCTTVPGDILGSSRRLSLRTRPPVRHRMRWSCLGRARTSVPGRWPTDRQPHG